MWNRLGRLALLILLLLGGLAIWKREDLIRLHAVNTLFAEDRIVTNFSNMDRLFWTAPVKRGTTPALPLPPGPALSLPPGYDDWITRRSVTAIVVLKDGDLVHEAYYKGTTATDRRISWSVGKSFISALIGISLDRGEIASLDDLVTTYVPALSGTAYDGVSLRNVLNMASGVSFDEDYLDFWSDINRMGRVLALGQSMDAFAAGLEARFTDPGAQWQYVSIDTHVLSMVLRAATGQKVPALLSDRVLQPLGIKDDAYYVTDGDGVAFALGGLNAMTRDYARFGQLFLQGGLVGRDQIVPEDWVAASTTPSAPTAQGKVRYGFQWWIPWDQQEGEFFARGVYGQYIYINPERGVVIALNSADKSFRADGAHEINLAMMRTIAAMTE